MDKILIAGLAKTGTTGLLYRIACAVGGEKRLIFEPSEYVAEPGDERKAILCKILIGPHLKLQSFAEFNKKITIVRDPRDRLISSLLYSQFHGSYVTNSRKVDAIRKILENKERNPGSVPLLDVARALERAEGHKRPIISFFNRVRGPQTWYESYVDGTRSAFLLRYEDFVTGNLTLLEDYLCFRLSLDCEVPNHLKRVVRTKGLGDWKNWFTEYDVEKMRPFLDPILQKYGYDTSWELAQQPMIRPEHCSGYFMRLVEERQRIVKNEAMKGLQNGEGHSKAFVKCVGHLDGVESRRIWGWAVGEEPDKPAKLIVAVNGAKRYEIIADRPRPGIAKKGLHPNGRCGFVLELAEEDRINAGDSVIISPVEQDIVITNNPSVFQS